MATYGQTLLSKCAVQGRPLSSEELAHLHGDELIQYATLGYPLAACDLERLDGKLLPRYEAIRRVQDESAVKPRPR
jgi:hypothetical protein